MDLGCRPDEKQHFAFDRDFLFDGEKVLQDGNVLKSRYAAPFLDDLLFLETAEYEHGIVFNLDFGGERPLEDDRHALGAPAGEV